MTRIMIVVMVIGIVLMIIGITAKEIHNSKITAKCHERGGVILDYTHVIGKLKEQAYACVDSKIIINLD